MRDAAYRTILRYLSEERPLTDAQRVELLIIIEDQTEDEEAEVDLAFRTLKTRSRKTPP